MVCDKVKLYVKLIIIKLLSSNSVNEQEKQCIKNIFSFLLIITFTISLLGWICVTWNSSSISLQITRSTSLMEKKALHRNLIISFTPTFLSLSVPYYRTDNTNAITIIMKSNSGSIYIFRFFFSFFISSYSSVRFVVVYD